MTELWHIASVVVQHRPEAEPRVAARVHSLDRAERVAGDATRSVVVCEAASERALVERMEALQELDGVLSVSLVHHHCEPLARLNEEIVDADPS